MDNYNNRIMEINKQIKECGEENFITGDMIDVEYDGEVIGYMYRHQIGRMVGWNGYVFADRDHPMLNVQVEYFDERGRTSYYGIKHDNRLKKYDYIQTMGHGEYHNKAVLGFDHFHLDDLMNYANRYVVQDEIIDFHKILSNIDN